MENQQPYDNTNRGVLFGNKRKETDNHPDYTGSIDIAGVEHWLSGWKKVSSKGETYLSLSIGKPKEEKPDAWKKVGQQLKQEEQINVADIPFN